MNGSDRGLATLRLELDVIFRSWCEISYSRSSPKGDRDFESTSLQRGVCCERHFRDAFHRRTEDWNPVRSMLLRSGCGERAIWSTELRDSARLRDASRCLGVRVRDQIEAFINADNQTAHSFAWTKQVVFSQIHELSTPTYATRY
jgi:hypothetical protein